MLYSYKRRQEILAKLPRDTQRTVKSLRKPASLEKADSETIRINKFEKHPKIHPIHWENLISKKSNIQVFSG